MKPFTLLSLVILLVSVAVPSADSRLQGSSMEIRREEALRAALMQVADIELLGFYTDIDSSWYTGRGIRPVGRFGRRGLTFENSRKYDFGTRRICIPIQEREDSSQDE